MKERKSLVIKVFMLIISILIPFCASGFDSHAQYVLGEDDIYMYIDVSRDPTTYIGETTSLCNVEVGSFFALSDGHLVKGTLEDPTIAKLTYKDSIFARTYFITGLKAGTTRLKIEFKGLVYYVPVQVKGTYARLITSSITLYPKQSTSISFYLDGRGAMKTSEFKSSNKKVATFNSSGVIKAKKVGKTKISFKVNGKKLSLTVKVVNRPPQVSDLKVKVENVSYVGTKCYYRLKFTNKSKFRITKIKVRLSGYIYEAISKTVTLKNLNIKPGRSLTKNIYYGRLIEKPHRAKAKVISFNYK